MIRFCPKCGTEVKGIFCSECGYKLPEIKKKSSIFQNGMIFYILIPIILIIGIVLLFVV